MFWNALRKKDEISPVILRFSRLADEEPKMAIADIFGAVMEREPHTLSSDWVRGMKRGLGSSQGQCKKGYSELVVFARFVGQLPNCERTPPPCQRRMVYARSRVHTVEIDWFSFVGERQRCASLHPTISSHC